MNICLNEWMFVSLMFLTMITCSYYFYMFGKIQGVKQLTKRSDKK